MVLLLVVAAMVTIVIVVVLLRSVHENLYLNIMSIIFRRSRNVTSNR